MALKAYRYLRNGELRIVEAGSQEDAKLAAEVNAPNGYRSWSDVSGELSGAQVFEATDLLIPAAADWSIETGTPYVVGEPVVVDPLQGYIGAAALTLASAPPANCDVSLALTPLDEDNRPLGDYQGTLLARVPGGVGQGLTHGSHGVLGSSYPATFVEDFNLRLLEGGIPPSLKVGFVIYFPPDSLTEDLTVARARGAFLLI